jgi:hypothetical protein
MRRTFFVDYLVNWHFWNLSSTKFAPIPAAAPENVQGDYFAAFSTEISIRESARSSAKTSRGQVNRRGYRTFGQ